MSLIIAFEGMDASGKATHTKLLAERLKGTVIDFPHYSTEVGKVIRAHLERKWACTDVVPQGQYSPPNEHDALVFQCLQTVNRLEMMPVIADAQQKGPVIFDRYYASALVYGGLDGLNPQWIHDIQASLPEPDLWLLLDIPPEESVRRRPERRDRYEQQPGLMKRVRETYLDLFQGKWAEDHYGAGHWYVVDGMGSREEVQARIWALVEPLLP